VKLQGVVTTGIYCRADCRARPHPKNLRPVRSGVDALAKGFRPCLVCRPDRIADLGRTSPTPELAHALRLIAEGYLDAANTDALAARIGYSTRHLVRLFRHHIGASPDFVARSRRAHLARRLLDESNLSVTRVAEAAGFTSTRQMNRVVLELFGFSPRVLRSKRRRGDCLDALDGGLRLRIPHALTTDIEGTFAFLSARAMPGVEVASATSYARTIDACGHPGVLEVQPSKDGAHLIATLHLASFGSLIEHVAQVRALFALDDPVDPSRAHLAKDDTLGALVRAHPRVVMPGAYDRFETAVRIIVGQQVSVAGATTVAARLAARLGDPVAVANMPEGLSQLFPTAHQLAGAKLDALGMPTARARTITRFAAAVEAGDLPLDGLLPLDEMLAGFMALDGIGPWTAHLVAGRVMRHPDAFPASDLGIRKGIAALLGEAAPVSARVAEKMAEQWRPYRFAAAAYLWLAASLSQKNAPRPLNPSVRKHRTQRKKR
jgi:AraC family transcriptional regulator, regulatory protein of adaptative response / DNA-3-methyladenine glycosylase II